MRISQRLRRLCAWIIGLILLCGGLVKIQDPVGSGLVMEEYFNFLHIGFMKPISIAVGLGFSLLECTLGILLMTGLFRKIVARLTICLMAFFTALTVLLIIFEPDMNCGCFGSALEISPYESFFKNILIDILCLFAFIPMRSIGKEARKKKYVSAAITEFCIILLATHSLLAIPIIDKTAYKPHTLIDAAEEIWEGDEEEPIEAETEIIFIYEKDGEQEEFTIEDIPEDSTWKYVETRVNEINPVEEIYSPAIEIFDSNGNYKDEELARGPIMIMSVYSPEKVTADKWGKICSFIEKSEHVGFNTFLLISGNEDDLHEIPSPSKERLSASSDIVYFCDYKTLISLNRSNAGVTFLNDGEIIKKWAYLYRPDTEKLQEIFTSSDVENIISSTDERLLHEAFILFIFAILLLL